ncbi:MAG: peptide-methionine (S)-S-oxide reductase MsrA [Candidatus Heimdallarchaeota archaeon]|nr:MAG: peptide-methionine (S)-S-oxide reductase MsrA [Candidatus Heimdallarchaeota archaeon]
MSDHTNSKITTLGGGCFWCLEAIFDDTQGVEKVISGYSGGKVVNPTYEDVCRGTTGHAEVVQIKFNQRLISFREILQIFFTIHDPTQLNRQGNDIGTQYRSVIFYHSKEQKAEAKKIINELEEDAIWPDPIVTEVTAFTDFFPAEEYHQDYFKRNPDQPYCQLIIVPKIIKFREKYANKWYKTSHL